MINKKYSPELAARFSDPNRRLVWEEESILQNFATQVEDALKKNGISKSKLAKTIKISPQSISRALGGDQNLTIRTMLRMCIHVGMTFKVSLEPLEKLDSIAAPSRVNTATISNNYFANKIDEPSNTKYKIMPPHVSQILKHQEVLA